MLCESSLAMALDGEEHETCCSTYSLGSGPQVRPIHFGPSYSKESAKPWKLSGSGSKSEPGQVHPLKTSNRKRNKEERRL